MAERRPGLRLVSGGGDHARLLPALELGALGVGLTFTIALLAQLPSWSRGLGTFQALLGVAFGFYGLTLVRLPRFAAVPHAGVWVFAVALATRAALLPVVPSLSDDVYRYVWEGRVASHGFDPYRIAPADPRFAPMRDREVWPRINHPELGSIYPPLGIAGFALVARISPTIIAMKLWVVLHDLALVLVLLAWCARGASGPVAVAAYAWNPLVLVEYAGTAHNDPTALLWLAAALMLAERRPVASALSLAAGVLVKLGPVVALPVLLVHWPWRARAACLATLAAGLGAFWGLTRGPGSGLEAFWSSWRNNELVFHYLERATGSFAFARSVAVAAVGIAIAIAIQRKIGPARATQWAVRTAALVTPVLHPWYLGWVLMFEPFTRSWPWLFGSLMVVLSYGVLATPPEGSSFHLPLAWRWVEYGVPALAGVAVLVVRVHRSHRGGLPRVP